MVHTYRGFAVGLFLAVCVAASSVYAQGDCGGTERWPVKMGSDPAAASIDPNSAIPVTIDQLEAIQPTDVIAGADERSRMQAELSVYQVQGYVAFFKSETDGDYHIVITDGTGAFARGHAEPEGHSFVAEIPNTACTGGAHGRYGGVSAFASQIDRARTTFQHRMIGVNGAHISPGSIPVVVTGLAFFDFNHGQTGRRVVTHDANGKPLVIELHPVIDVSFPGWSDATLTPWQ